MRPYRHIISELLPVVFIGLLVSSGHSDPPPPKSPPTVTGELLAFDPFAENGTTAVPQGRNPFKRSITKVKGDKQWFWYGVRPDDGTTKLYSGILMIRAARSKNQGSDEAQTFLCRDRKSSFDEAVPRDIYRGYHQYDGLNQRQLSITNSYYKVLQRFHMPLCERRTDEIAYARNFIFEQQVEPVHQRTYLMSFDTSGDGSWIPFWVGVDSEDNSNLDLSIQVLNCPSADNGLLRFYIRRETND